MQNMREVCDQKLKVNFVIPSTVLGGGVRMVFTYANYLVSQGHDVVVYVPKLFVWEDMNHGRINWKTSLANTFKRGTKVGWYDCHFSICLANKISDVFIRDADITIATAWYTAKEVSKLSAKKGKKVYFIQDYEVAQDGHDKDLVEASYKLGMTNITIANWLDKIVYDITGKNTLIIQNGVADAEIMTEEKNINNPKTVIMLGNMAAHKGTEKGIKILKKMQNKYNIRVIVFASTKSDEFPDTFEFYCKPERSRLMELYTEADICLFPSIREGWGLIVTEAMAHKCAVVGNNTGAISEIGRDRENVLIASDFNPSTLESCLEEVIVDDKLMVRIQNGGYETAMKLKNSIQFRKFENCLLNLL